MSEKPGNGGGPDPGAAAVPGPQQHADAAAPGQHADMGADMAARIAELEDLRLRALADLDNLRKKCASQVSRAEAATRAAVAREWLPVIDNLERALTHSRSDPAAIVEGIQAVRDQALGVLARLGFPRRDDRGARFDPARHDAVAARADPGAEDGSVVEVIRPGYGDGDHQLRPAQVVVAKAD